MGSGHPVRLQSMTNTSTQDVDATVEQCIRIAEAGADYVRCTVQGVKEAEAMRHIRDNLRRKGCAIPLIADVHFSAHIAEVVAPYVDKVRINPGNFVDKRAGSTAHELSEEEYQQELTRLSDKLKTLLNICRKYSTAIRIGVNHGSLSDRIMSRYGDTPEGMVESAMEFLRICKAEDFNIVVLSMKSSNTRVMVYAYRMLVKQMDEEGMRYPLHLGVTEAGEGEDGRLKSTVGIGALLADGIGDTIRVSLTEEPENEIPVARWLAGYTSKSSKHRPVPEVSSKSYSPYTYQRRKSESWGGIIGDSSPVAVIADLSTLNPIYDKDLYALGYTQAESGSWRRSASSPDVVYIGSSVLNVSTNGLCVISDESDNVFRCTTDMVNSDLLCWLKQNPQQLVCVETTNENAPLALRAFFLQLQEAGISSPVAICHRYKDGSDEHPQLAAAYDLGALLLDGFGDAVMVSNTRQHLPALLVSLSFAILQAARVRFTKTEYIACPSCGRTLFDLQKSLAEVKAATQHLSTLKIAVMGCIVNGPGEMADADYGYVGFGVGKVALYKGKTLVKKNIPQEEAVNELVALLKQSGDWCEPS